MAARAPARVSSSPNVSFVCLTSWLARLQWQEYILSTVELGTISPPHPSPPPPGGREPSFSLPPGGGGGLVSPSPLVGEGALFLPPPLWGRVPCFSLPPGGGGLGWGGQGKNVKSPRAQHDPFPVPGFAN